MNIIYILIIAGASLLITYILFKYLKATAEGEGRVLNGTVKYGGSLAGFAVIFTLLFGGYAWLRKDQNAPEATFSTIVSDNVPDEVVDINKTDINIAGMWELRFVDDFDEGGSYYYRSGNICIRQEKGSTVFDLSGELVKTSPNDLATFSTDGGKIINSQGEFNYSLGTNDSVTGKATMVIIGNRPERLLVEFQDDDYNNTGSFRLTKTDEDCSN